MLYRCYSVRKESLCKCVFSLDSGPFFSGRATDLAGATPTNQIPFLAMYAHLSCTARAAVPWLKHPH